MRLGPDHKLYIATGAVGALAAGLLWAAVQLTQSAEGGDNAIAALVMVWLFVTAMAYAAKRAGTTLVIRVPVEGISFRSRSAGGVRVFNTAAGEFVVSVARIADQGDSEDVEAVVVEAGGQAE